MANERLTTTRYVTPGTYIGELIRPSGADVIAERRILVCIGRGDRLAVAPNLRVRRAFVFNESLSFPSSPAYVANLQFDSDEDASPDEVVLQKTDGSAVRKDQWRFTGPKTVEINSEAFDATADYVISYQSIDRTVLDPIPISNIRQIREVGLQEDQDQFLEGIDNDYFVTFSMEGPDYREDDNGDPIITNTNPTLEAPLKVEDGGGTALLEHDVLSTYTHDYDRLYEFEVVEVTGSGGSEEAIFKWTSKARSGGNSSLPNTPLFWDTVDDQRPTFTVLESAIGTAIDLELGLKIKGVEPAGNFFRVGDKFSFYVLGPAFMEQDIRHINTNQYDEASPVIKDGTGSGDIDVDVSQFTNIDGSKRNVNFKLECIAANDLNGSVLVGDSPAPVDGDTLTVNDGVNSPATVFEFDDNASVGAGNVAVTIVDKGAIGFVFMDANPTPGDSLTITDAVTAATDIYEFGTSAIPGSITVTVGGTAAATMANLITAINGSGTIADLIPVPTTLATTAIERLVTTSLPLDGETLTIDDGVNTPVTFEFDDDSTVETGNIAVDILATKELTIADLMNKINDISLSLDVLATIMASDEIIVRNTNLGTAVIDITGSPTGYTLTSGAPAIALTHTTGGTGGNASTSSATGSAVKNSTNFYEGGVDVEATAANLETAINGVTGTLSITATRRASSSFVDLVNDTPGQGVTLSQSGTSLTLVDDSADIAWFIFNAYGEKSIGGKFMIEQGQDNVTSPAYGINIDFTDPVLGTFDVGDTFEFTVNAVRVIPTAKDNREVFLTVSSVLGGIINTSFVSNTPEGSFGSLSFEHDNSDEDEAYQTLPGQLKITTRNISTSVSAKRIVQSGLPNDGETVTIDDGVNPPEIFEFDTNSTFTNTQVDISGLNAIQAIQKLAEVINASSNINVFATFKNGTTTFEELFVHNLAALYPTALTIALGIVDSSVIPSGNYSTDASLTNAPLDEYEIDYTSTEFIDWSLTKIETVEIDLDAHPASQDVNGSITGTVGTFYIVLPRIPIAGTTIVTNLHTGDVIPTQQVPDTAFITFVGNPNSLYADNTNSADLSVEFEHVGDEPSPGQDYFMTVLSIRPDEFYESVQLVTTRAEGQQLLAPSSVNNHLYIANEIAYDQDPGTVIAYIQVKDSDDDGIYSQDDWNRALDMIRTDKRLTDYIVLSSFQNLNRLLSINIEGMDPFVGRENLVWVGAPIGTEIGIQSDPDSLIGIAKGALQVYGNSPAHGTRILHASTWGKKTITLDNGLDQELTLDGSFVAVSLATLSNSFTDPGTTILRKAILGWNDIQTYGDNDNLTLGAASIIFLSDQGSGVFRVDEDHTVDKFAIEFNLISVMVQKQVVTKVVRSDMDERLISLVTEVVEGSISAIEGTLVTILNGVVGRGFAAPYQDDQGVARSLDPSLDIKVTIDEVDPTTFHFGYGFFTKKPIKRLFGLYVVDRGFNQD